MPEEYMPQPYKHPPSHLDIENPEFYDVPHIWIQWKGTSVCCDVNCKCGCSAHFDGDFMYFIKCPSCGTVWEVGTHVKLYEVTDDRAKGAIIQEADL